jgi:hypothetical protein
VIWPEQAAVTLTDKGKSRSSGYVIWPERYSLLRC